jgi:hypothetical protein
MQVPADLNDADIRCDPQRQGNGREYRRQKVKWPKTQRKDAMPCEFKPTGILLDGSRDDYPLLPNSARKYAITASTSSSANVGLPPLGGIASAEPGLWNPSVMLFSNASSGLESAPSPFVKSATPGNAPLPFTP